MASPAFVRLPDDAANTGKKIRTRSRVVGSDTVHEHVNVNVYPEDILGLYYLYTGKATVLATAHSTITGFFYLQNPIGSGITAALRRIRLFSTPIDGTTFASTPEITVERFTFTGTASGASINPAKGDSAFAANSLVMRTANTGMTITAGNVMRGFVIPFVPAAVSAVTSGNDQTWEPLGDEGESLIKPGEGIVFRQASNGTTSDTRIITFNLTWLEY